MPTPADRAALEAEQHLTRPLLSPSQQQAHHAAKLRKIGVVRLACPRTDLLARLQRVEAEQQRLAERHAQLLAELARLPPETS